MRDEGMNGLVRGRHTRTNVTVLGIGKDEVCTRIATSPDVCEFLI